MAVYTINTTAGQEAGLARVVGAENARRAAQRPPLPPLTNDQYIQNLWASALASYVQQRTELLHDDLRTAYQGASSAVQNQVRAALGVTP